MGASVLALTVANSPLALAYEALLALPVEVRLGTFEIAKPLLLWVNDGLMAVFFLLIGMELKREIVEGHLSDLQSATLPAFAAIGGMLGPAVIYAALNWGDSVALRGWAIPAIRGWRLASFPSSRSATQASPFSGSRWPN